MERRQVLLATIAFTVCFSVWALIGPLAPEFREIYGLSEFGTAVLIAVPVLLGSVLRIPVGILADRYGGRRVFSGLLAFTAVPSSLIALGHSYWLLLVGAFFLGAAGAGISAGVSHVAGWAPPQRQGTALGVLGIGNVGTALSVFAAPRLSAALGWAWVFCVAGMMSLVCGVVFWCLGRDGRAPHRHSLRWISHLFVRSRLIWVLSSFYVVTLGGFVALGGYLPTFLVREFHLSLADAGLRTAGFATVAAVARPVGGRLADRLGGERVLQIVFAALVPGTILLISTDLRAFTVGALGSGAMMGLGNGAVFKLAAQYFAGEIGAVTGLIAAVGGLGGFVLPILFGIAHEITGGYGPAFVLLAVGALAMLRLDSTTFGAHKTRGGPTRSHSVIG